MEEIVKTVVAVLLFLGGCWMLQYFMDAAESVKRIEKKLDELEKKIDDS